MSQNPYLRKLVLRGYVKLVAFLVGLCLLFLPMVLVPGLGGVRTTQVACGVMGLALAVWQWLRREWSFAFCAGLVAWSLASIALAYIVAIRDPNAQAAKDVLIVFVVGFVCFGLAPTSSRRPTRR